MKIRAGEFKFVFLIFPSQSEYEKEFYKSKYLLFTFYMHDKKMKLHFTRYLWVSFEILGIFTLIFWVL